MQYHEVEALWRRQSARECLVRRASRGAHVMWPKPLMRYSTFNGMSLDMNNVT